MWSPSSIHSDPMAARKTLKTITLSPLSVIFSNENRQLGISLHSHHAEVRLSYSFEGFAGFPVLAATMDLVKERLDSLLAEPFLNRRNEEILDVIFQGFVDWECPTIRSYAGEWKLMAVDLTVFSTRDRFGHADGATTYRVEVS